MHHAPICKIRSKYHHHNQQYRPFLLGVTYIVVSIRRYIQTPLRTRHENNVPDPIKRSFPSFFFHLFGTKDDKRFLTSSKRIV
jgi:hypothetical protein